MNKINCTASQHETAAEGGDRQRENEKTSNKSATVDGENETADGRLEEKQPSILQAIIESPAEVGAWFGGAAAAAAAASPMNSNLR